MVLFSTPHAVADAGTRRSSRPRGARMGGVAPCASAATGARRTPTKIVVLRRFCGLAGARAAL